MGDIPHLHCTKIATSKSYAIQSQRLHTVFAQYLPVTPTVSHTLYSTVCLPKFSAFKKCY